MMSNKTLTGDDLVFLKPDYSSIGFIDQYLVFPNQETSKLFETDVLLQILADPNEVTLNGHGALFKVRAVCGRYPHPRRFDAEIWCGVSGEKLWQADDTYASEEDAYEAAFDELKYQFGELYEIPKDYVWLSK